jgi:hypothetical protein
MTTERTDTVSDLSVVADPVVQVWSKGTAEDGVDERLELALMDSGARLAVRETRNPSGPALLFSRSDWQTFIGAHSTLVDLRDGSDLSPTRT